MSDLVEVTQISPRVPWNKGKLVGPKPPLRPKQVWLQLEGQMRDLANPQSSQVPFGSEPGCYPAIGDM
jgi:hypothetical protein